jgi:hypothetical protein
MMEEMVVKEEFDRILSSDSRMDDEDGRCRGVDENSCA